MSEQTHFATYPSLSTSHVFITGGASGIGRTIVDHFLTQGATVSTVDIDEAALSTLPPEVWRRRCDVRDIDGLQQSIKDAAHFNGKIQVLVNNAASDMRQAIEDVSVESWDNSQAINLRPHFFAIQQVLDGMKKIGGGSIINLSSNSYLIKVGGMPSYVTAKAAIVGMTKAVARDVGKHNIRVNAVLPGWVMTKRQETLWLTPEAETDLLRTQCIPTKIYPPDVARMVLFLAAEDSKLITAQSFVVDAGRA